MNQLLGLIDLVLGICHDQAVKVFLLVAVVSCVGATLAFFDGALSSDSNLCARFVLHLLQSITTRSDKQADFSAKSMR